MTNVDDKQCIYCVIYVCGRDLNILYRLEKSKYKVDIRTRELNKAPAITPGGVSPAISLLKLAQTSFLMHTN